MARIEIPPVEHLGRVMPGVSAVNSWMYARREVEVRRSLSPNSNRHQREISVGDLAEPGCHHKLSILGAVYAALLPLRSGRRITKSRTRACQRKATMDFIRFALEDKSAKAAKPVRYDRHRFEADACNANRRRINPPPDSPAKVPTA